MKDENTDTGKQLPIERFKHFKGIQLTTTGEYFCCDFYEIIHSDSTITYRIIADSRDKKFSTEIYLDGESWKSKNPAVPKELEQRLTEIIEDTFYEKNKVSPEPQPKPVNTPTFIHRLKNALLRKLHLMKPSKNNRTLPLIISLVVLFTAMTGYAIYAQLTADQYIVPYGYTGKVTIIYNQQRGVAVKSNENKRQFYIPANGMLTTQSAYSGNKAKEFYFRMPDGTLQQLTQGEMWGTGMMRQVSDDTFSVGDVNVTYIDSLKANKAEFTITKNQ